MNIKKEQPLELVMDDIVIIGGGIIGAAAAYFLSKEGRKVKVIERDPTKTRRTSLQAFIRDAG